MSEAEVGAEPNAQFDRLQKKLVPLWKSIECLNQDPQTIVVVPSISIDGLGAGAYTTSLAVHSQYYLWMPNGRILRTRLNIAYAMSDSVDVADTSVYGTSQGFRGRADPGDTFSIYSAWEYSVTRNWVLALDVFYQHDASTRIRGTDLVTVNGAPERVPFEAESGSAWRFGLAPALEYNWTSRVGVIFGARWFAAGHNTSASVTPVAAINMVY